MHIFAYYMWHYLLHYWNSSVTRLETRCHRIYHHYPGHRDVHWFYSSLCDCFPDRDEGTHIVTRFYRFNIIIFIYITGTIFSIWYLFSYIGSYRTTDPCGRCNDFHLWLYDDQLYHTSLPAYSNISNGYFSGQLASIDALFLGKYLPVSHPTHLSWCIC